MQSDSTKYKPKLPPIFISLGAGVQSSTMALMASHGELPGHERIQGAIFADTQNEPVKVYEWLDWLEGQLRFPLHRVTRGNLAEDSLVVRVSKNTGKAYLRNLIPAFIDNSTREDLTPDQQAKRGTLSRKCSTDYKVEMIVRTIRNLIDLPRKREQGVVYATSWLGISLDEVQRMKPSRLDWVTNEFPLVDANMTREDCFRWMERNGYPRPPRSACTFCPYHSNAEWRRLRENPEDWQQAVEFEKRLQKLSKQVSPEKGVPYLHGSLVPLDEANIEDDVKGQQYLWDNECTGGCAL